MLFATVVAVVAAPPAAKAQTAESLEFFENRIRPVLATNCYVCHSAEAKTRMGGLSLDTREGIRQGGQRGHAVVPSAPDESLLLSALRYEGNVKMPPGGRLPDRVIADFEAWIRMGAPDPRESAVKSQASSINVERGRGFWAFRAPRKDPLPAVQNLSWPRGAIDQHVLAGLEHRDLRPVGDATRTDLLRRSTFDLTGLPPTVDELQAFLSDESPRAFAKVVDRLLESERFGERWGRHWLDVVRYADTIGRTRNLPFPMAWRYRDYVIDSFNRDKPYDRFIREQIAGDLLPYESAQERAVHQVATGFLALGAHDLNEPDPKQFEMDIADEMINVTTRSVLALSVGCARCHDHKFDPIPAADYYALGGIFRSTELRNGLRRRPRFNGAYFLPELMVELDELPAYSSPGGEAHLSERRRLWAEMRAAEDRRDRNAVRAAVRELAKIPMPENLAMGVVEADQPANIRLNIGGDPHTLGDEVPRGFVQVMFPAGAELPSIGPGRSGRLQLAEWLVRPDNPLTARVMANRVWRHLLGKGLVGTVDNFGSSGQRPTNQALLDYLAVRFIEGGWSVKGLIREIVLSRTYQLATEIDEGNFAKDPDNDHIWRASLRRLEAEAVRDAVLMVSGELSETPKASPVASFDPFRLINPGTPQISPWEVSETYRSVFVPVIRNAARPMFEAFDFPEPSETKGARDVTTGPAQALFLMNGEFVRLHSLTAAERLLAAEQSDRVRVRHAFRQVLNRDPSTREEDLTMRHVASVTDWLLSPETLDNGRSEAKEWLSGLLGQAFGRDPGGDELDSAVAVLPGGAADSRAAVRAAFDNGEGNLRYDVLFAAVSAAFGRVPDQKERGSARKRLKDWLAAERANGGIGSAGMAVSASPQHEAWARVYHALFNSAEFRYRN